MSDDLARKWLERRQNRYFRSFLEAYRPELNWRFPHLLLMQERLELAIEQAAAGKKVRLMVFEPPRHGKSSLITEGFPSYCLHKRPAWKVMIGAFNETKATDFTRNIRRITTRSGIRLSDDRAAAHEWQTVFGGGAKAAGVQTGAPGYGANVLILDDPVRNRGDANSQVISDKVYNEFSDSFLTRLHMHNMVIIVLTRWSELDLAGRLLADDPKGWEVINLPAIAGENDMLGRKEGEALCPELIPLERLEWFRDNRPRTFESLYQGNPSVATGNIFQRDWFKYYDRIESHNRVILSLDTAFKEKQENDPSCIGTWLETDTGAYLEDVIVDRMSFPKLRDCLKSVADRTNPNLILIEDAASGQSLIQDLQSSTRLPIIPVSADSSKISRAHATTGHYESGNIFHRRNAPWLADYERELLSFPNGKHDDQVDMTTQFINNALQAVPDIIIV